MITPNVSMAGLDVHREITVSSGQDHFARTVDVFHNPSLQPITTTVRIVGNLGTDAETSVWTTSDGDALVETTDEWIGTDDADGAGSPAVLHYVHGSLGVAPASIACTADNVEWTYELTVPSGGTARLAHFTIVTETRAEAEASAASVATAVGFTQAAAAFLTAEELSTIVNFDTPPVADAGGPYLIEPGNDLLLDATASYDPDANPNESIVSYQWDVNDDGVYDYTGATVNVPWADLQNLPQPGIPIRVTLMVEDSFGIADTDVALLSIGELNVDFGDAPEAGYPTRWASDGAWHGVVPDFHLGAAVDSDFDGQPDAAADGDDSDGVDDEDGVVLVDPLIPGQTSQIVVTASDFGHVTGWIDFNGDGVWSTPEEFVVGTGVLPGENVIDVSVPSTAISGETFMRFRFASSFVMQPSGGAEDGEVEDYRVYVFQPIEELGTVDFLVREDVALVNGGFCLQLERTRAGWLTADAVVADGSVQLALFDDLTHAPLSTSLDVGGRQRIDWPDGDAGDTYYLTGTGSASSVDLRIANLVSHEGTSVTVHGTDGEDTFEFDASASRNITINGVLYEFSDADVGSVTFDGGAGDDTAILRGSGADEIGRLYPDHGTFEVAGAYSVDVSDVNSITAHGGGGADGIYMYDSPGDDTFEASPFHGKLSGPGFVHEAFDFMYTYGYATTAGGGHDTAIFADSTKKDKFKLDWPQPGQFFGKMYRGDYYNRAKMFEVIEATSSNDGDLARLYGSEGDDTFEGQKDTSRMVGPGFDVTIHNYHSLIADAGSGYDLANLHDTAGDDTVRARSHKTEIYDTLTKGEDYRLIVRHFSNVHLWADTPAGGNDVAKLHDTPGEDLFEATPDWARLSKKLPDGSFDLLYEALGFERVKSYGLLGGPDKAILHDTPGDDLLEAKYVADLGQDDTWAGLWTNQDDSLRLLYDVIAFEQVEVKSSTGRNTTKIAPGVDFLMLDDGWEM